MDIIKYRNRYKINRFFEQFWRQIALLFMAGTIIFPLYFMIVTSFKSKQSYLMEKMMPPINPTLENFIQLFNQRDFLIWFMNSTIFTVSSVAVVTVIASLAAYALSKMNFKGKHIIFSAIVSLMVIPPIVIVVPLFMLMARFELINTYPAVIIIYIGIMLPFSIYLLRNFFVTIPDAIVDSALIDGCSSLKIFTYIIVPLSKPALITLSLVNAFWVWNELLIALIFLQSNSLRTLMVGIVSFKSKYDLNVPFIFAGMIFAALPMIILYVLGQSYFVKGITAGSVKGE